jgi:hypothetical protein
MAKYLIEVSHGEDQAACARAVHTFLVSASHFLSSADWGCSDGEHKAWLVVDVEDRADAEAIVPLSFRNQAKIIKLDSYTSQKVQKAMSERNS